MIECIVDTKYSDPTPRRVDVRPGRKVYTETTRLDINVPAQLVQRWHIEVGTRSSLSDVRALPSFKALVGLGRSAIPAIVEDLFDKPSMLFIALHDITGQNPVRPEDRGNVRAMSSAWVRWYLNKR